MGVSRRGRPTPELAKRRCVAGCGRGSTEFILGQGEHKHSRIASRSHRAAPGEISAPATRPRAANQRLPRLDKDFLQNEVRPKLDPASARARFIRPGISFRTAVTQHLRASRRTRPLHGTNEARLSLDG